MEYCITPSQYECFSKLSLDTVADNECLNLCSPNCKKVTYTYNQYKVKYPSNAYANELIEKGNQYRSQNIDSVISNLYSILENVKDINDIILKVKINYDSLVYVNYGEIATMTSDTLFGKYINFDALISLYIWLIQFKMLFIIIKGNVGGLLGLYLGVSVLVVAELIELIVFSIYNFYNGQKQHNGKNDFPLLLQQSNNVYAIPPLYYVSNKY